jgi:hypothetical protein
MVLHQWNYRRRERWHCPWRWMWAMVDGFFDDVSM